VSGMCVECRMDSKRRDFDRRSECAGREVDSLQENNNQFEDQEKRRWLQQ
jgi:hypothetical protein